MRKESEAVRKFLTEKSENVLSPPCLKVVKYLKSSRLIDQTGKPTIMT